jgi:hypothetical protein
LWLPHISPHVLKLYLADPESCPHETPLTWEEIWSHEHVIVDWRDATHGLINLDDRWLQVFISGVWTGKRMCVLTGAVSDNSTAQLRILAGLQAFFDGRRTPSGTFPPDNRSQRHLTVCNALDGRLEGLSDQQIAGRIYGVPRVNADWADPGGYLRDHTRRAIRRGLFLMRRGYLSLLK